MKIGIISDTHSKVTMAKEVLDLLIKNGAELNPYIKDFSGKNGIDLLKNCGLDQDSTFESITKDIEQLVDDFVKAAVRACKAGFDGVEIHGAHLYLLSQFLSPLTNKRDDRYGGTAKNRATLALEIVKKVRQNIGDQYPIFFRINAEEKIEGGQTLEDAIIIGKLLANEGVDIFDVSLIAHGSWKKDKDKNYLVGSSALAKDKPSELIKDQTSAFKKEVRRPVIVVGKFGVGNAAVHAVENEQIELVAIGRQMICDPLSAKKILNGNGDEIIPCDECLKCFATIGKGSPMACKVNKNLPL